jgi:hypothetical protein
LESAYSANRSLKWNLQLHENQTKILSKEKMKFVTWKQK